MLVDIVSKNGNLMLSIPVRGDGTIDEDEVAFLEALAAWMPANGEAIFGTRPWKIYGEGPSVSGPVQAGQFGGARDVARPTRPRTSASRRKGDALYAFLMGWPTEPRAVVTSLALQSPHLGGRKITDVTLLGAGPVAWSQSEQGLVVTLPAKAPSDHAACLRIRGAV